MARALLADECPARTAPVTLTALRLTSLCAAVISIAAVTLALPSSLSAVAFGTPVPLAGSAASPAGRPAASVRAGRPSQALPKQQTDLERQTGLSVTIDDVQPVSLTRGEPLSITGSVSNVGRKHWRDAKVYFEVGGTPATTRAGLDIFASQDAVYGTRLIKLGLFDEIGPVRPGETSQYQLSVPFSMLPIEGTPGVYNIGVSVLAQNRAGRDSFADARVDTLVPLLPTRAEGSFRPTSVATLVPLTAPVLRQNNGNFLDDRLARGLSVGGRLSNVIQFVDRAPRGSLQVVLDPALRDAVQAMAQGYVVQTLAEASRGEPGRDGVGQRDAARWLSQLRAVARRQRLSLLPWGAPDASALAAHQMPGVVASAVSASRSYAIRNSLDSAIVGWQPPGFSSRRGLAATRRAGTSVQVVAERSLTQLPVGDSGYSSAVVQLSTQLGPLTTVVTRRGVAGMPLTPSTPALQFRQRLLAEATVRDLLNEGKADAAVFALPFDWNPGTAASTVDLTPAYRSPALRLTTINDVAGRAPSPYDGPVKVSAQVRPYPSGVLAAITTLRHNGRVLTGMLTRRSRATEQLNQRLGTAGSAAWRNSPSIAAAAIRQQAAALGYRIAKVTVTGPTFVALSSASGRFPITVTNGLSVPITVRVDVHPQNPALRVDSIDNLELAAGQRRDVQIVSRAAGSGLTQVQVRLSTTNRRPFGPPWNFNVRATQVGVVIWVAMGVGASVLFGAAALRIYRRIRDSRRSTSSHPAVR